MKLKLGLIFFISSLLFSLPTIAQFSQMSRMREFSRTQSRMHAMHVRSYKKKKENGDNVDGFYRSQSLFNYGFVSANYRLDYTYPGGYLTNGSKFSQYFSGEIDTKVNGTFYGFGGEHYFPLGKMSETSTLALTIGVEANYMKLKFEEIRLNGGQRFTPSHDMIQFNLPIGAAFKSGTDVVFRKNIKSGFSFGGGAQLGFNAGLDGPSTTSIRPFALAEVAFYTGFCWKIRGTGYFGNTVIAKGSENVGIGGSEEETTMTITAKSALMLSIVIMDFSWDWDEE